MTTSTGAPHVCGADSIDPTTQRSLMPDHSALTMGLAERAFRLIGRSRLDVSAVLSVNDPEGLRAFGQLESILLMAYQAGAASRPDLASETAADVLG